MQQDAQQIDGIELIGDAETRPIWIRSVDKADEKRRESSDRIKGIFISLAVAVVVAILVEVIKYYVPRALGAVGEWRDRRQIAKTQAERQFELERLNAAARQDRLSSY